jgi:hypothetical protein
MYYVMATYSIITIIQDEGRVTECLQTGLLKRLFEIIFAIIQNIVV